MSTGPAALWQKSRGWCLLWLLSGCSHPQPPAASPGLALLPEPTVADPLPSPLGTPTKTAPTVVVSVTPAGPCATWASPSDDLGFAQLYACQRQTQRHSAAQQTWQQWLRQAGPGGITLHLLYQPGQTQWHADGRLSSPYRHWLRELGQYAQRQQRCLSLTGHVAKDESDVPRLAWRRAQQVAQQLRPFFKQGQRLKTKAAPVPREEALWQRPWNRQVSVELHAC